MTARVFGRRAVLAGLSVQQEPSAAWGAAAAAAAAALQSAVQRSHSLSRLRRSSFQVKRGM